MSKSRPPALETDDYIDPNKINEGCLKILARVKPDWQREDIKFEVGMEILRQIKPNFQTGDWSPNWQPGDIKFEA